MHSEGYGSSPVCVCLFLFSIMRMKNPKYGLQRVHRNADFLNNYGSY